MASIEQERRCAKGMRQISHICHPRSRDRGLNVEPFTLLAYWRHAVPFADELKAR